MAKLSALICRISEISISDEFARYLIFRLALGYCSCIVVRLRFLITSNDEIRLLFWVMYASTGVCYFLRSKLVKLIQTSLRGASVAQGSVPLVLTNARNTFPLVTICTHYDANCSMWVALAVAVWFDRIRIFRFGQCILASPKNPCCFHQKALYKFSAHLYL